MTEYTEHLLRKAPGKDTGNRFRFVWLVGIPLIAVLFQVYVPRFVGFLGYLELPLLITVHFALSRGAPIPGLLYGMFIGLVQDSLSLKPYGMYGIVKTLVGYFAASVSMRFDVQNPVVTFILSFFFYFFHQFFYWVLERALLGEAVTFDLQQTLTFGLLNAAVALPLFRILDKLKMAN
ncbi:MAG TPA: rod shape-determining protein MreD [Bryobacteraceae bacterium]|jgi:rod shape-determining protein MreD|nr:rod shape-determining protein MreD [Bryobacteraceae bacterium]